MYYPVGWQKVLNFSDANKNDSLKIISITTNHEKNLLLVLTTSSIHIWSTKPQVEIVSHKRNVESITKVGFNQTAIWKPDSSVIVVSTTYNQLLFYRVQRKIPLDSGNSIFNGAFKTFSSNLNDATLYKLHIEHKKSNSDSISFNHNEDIPAICVFLFGKLDLTNIGFSCLMSAEEELIFSSKNGDIHGILWDGTFDEQFPWTLKETFKKNVFITDLKFSAMLGGFSAVYSDGSASFIAASDVKETNKNSNHNLDSNKMTKTSLKTIFLDIAQVKVTEVNHKFRLLAFGLENSETVVYSVGDIASPVTENHCLRLPIEQYPKAQFNLGPVYNMKYSPDSLAIATSWKSGHFAIWSVFGSLLFFSGQFSQEAPTKITSLAWGLEGYSLFMSVVKSTSQKNSSKSSDTKETESDNKLQKNYSEQVETEANDLMMLSMARSSITLSSNSTCLSDTILLVSEDTLYVGSNSQINKKMDLWSTICIPIDYLRNNFPVRKAITDRLCSNIAIAGNCGFAIYNVLKEKWHVYPKSAEFTITGDLIWWNTYLIFTCYTFETAKFELKAFNTRNVVHLNFINLSMTQEVINMSVFENRLIVLYVDGTMGMFMLNLKKSQKLDKKKSPLLRSNSFVMGSRRVNGIRKDSEPTSLDLSLPIMSDSFDTSLDIAHMQGLVVSDLLANPYCISAITLTRLHFKNDRSDDSILLNACGKLFLLEREILPSASQPSLSNSHKDTSIICSSSMSEQTSKQITDLEKRLNEAKEASNHIHYASASLKNATNTKSSFVAFKTVTMIATNVEHYWISPDLVNASDSSYFRKSLWLYCGGPKHDLEVWLPLLSDKNDPPNSHQYTPDRIMLHIQSDVYPLAIKSSNEDRDIDAQNDTVILSAENDFPFEISKNISLLPYFNVKRQCQIYLHRILLELLKRNLGYHARKIAIGCQKLPYFAHAFELLLHVVLEEEASTPKPVPDPMLPQVIEFIKQFSDVYYQTIVHCARKSELALWPHLFSIVGNPRKFFQDCLNRGSLETAASCLIILQSFDRNTVSQEMVVELINLAKKDSKYEYLIEDLENFFERAKINF